MKKSHGRLCELTDNVRETEKVLFLFVDDFISSGDTLLYCIPTFKSRNYSKNILKYKLHIIVTRRYHKICKVLKETAIKKLQA